MNTEEEKLSKLVRLMSKTKKAVHKCFDALIQAKYDENIAEKLLIIKEDTEQKQIKYVQDQTNCSKQRAHMALVSTNWDMDRATDLVERWSEVIGEKPDDTRAVANGEATSGGD